MSIIYRIQEITLLLLIYLLCIPAYLTAQEHKTYDLKGHVNEVTLYKEGTALVSREIQLKQLPLGVGEVIITDLPATTVGTSVYADMAHGIQIRSVAFRSRPPKSSDDLKTQVQKRDQDIKGLERQLSEVSNHIRLLRRRQDILKSLSHFTTIHADKDLQHGVLKAKDLEHLTLMQFKEYEAASQKILKLDFQQEDFQQKLNRLHQQKRQQAADPLMRYDAVVLLDKKEENAAFRLNYLVKDCGWTPVYHVKGSSKNTQTATLEFNALIHQVSGESWDNITLHLSTASPKNSAFNPILSPLYVHIGSTNMAARPQSQQGLRLMSNAFHNQNSYNVALIKRKKAMIGQLKGGSFEEIANANFDANDSAANVQIFEISKQVSELRTLQEQMTEEDLSIHYTLSTATTLPSRREGQMIPVFQKNIPATYYHVATPILTPAIFREAELTNGTLQDLLGGHVNVYLDGVFTGKTSIPTIARGRTFTLGFGVDGQLRTHRTLVDRTESVQGGNQLLTLTVDVMIDNYNPQTTRVILKERMPYMDDTSRLRVHLTKSSEALSDNVHYKRIEKPKGLLLWDLQVKSGSGEQATSVRYTYSVEFDKNYQVQEIAREHKTKLKRKFLQESRKTTKKNMKH
jgi:uncharacterized protein (TIGR02231 family)